ncbi:hypothetical protein CYY_007467 [Polysphondylium violaceum]|uniref:MACPF domain-containing protein n=1 Tax=Polysphondylium violaceum TaxID=133409 RepID=A0A8J4PNL0_9MYCE|nr:hypothetical protein CYY_007467 [Polysphondylium violaceum]
MGYSFAIEYKNSTLRTYSDRNLSPVGLISTGCTSLQYYVLFEGTETIKNITCNQEGISSFSYALIKTVSPKRTYEFTFDVTYQLDTSLLSVIVETQTKNETFILSNSPISCKGLSQLQFQSQPILIVKGSKLEISLATDIKQFFKSSFSCTIFDDTWSTTECTVAQSDYSPDIFILTTPITQEIYSKDVVNINLSFDQNAIIQLKDIATPFIAGTTTSLSFDSYPVNKAIENDYKTGKRSSIVLSTSSTNDTGIILANGQVISSFTATFGNVDSKTFHSFVNYDLASVVVDPIIKVLYKNADGVQESEITIDPTLATSSMNVTANVSNDSSQKLPILKVLAKDVIISNPIQVSSKLGNLEIPFPFGIKKDGAKYNYVSDQIFPFVLNSQNTVSVNNKRFVQDAQVVIPATSPLTQDVTAPSYSIKSKKSYDNFITYQLTITDQTSGVYKIRCINTDQEFFAADTIISGSVTNGVFEFTIDLARLVSSSSKLILHVTDLYSNTNVYQGDSIYLDDNLNYPFDLFSTKVYLKDIIDFEFNSNLFDTSFKAKKNSLFFNLINGDTSFKPIIQLSGSTFIGSFDQVVQKYRIDFDLPFKPSVQVLDYQLVFPGSAFSFNSLQSHFGDVAIIKFINTDIDSYPPMFSKIDYTTGAQQVILSSSSENKQVGWRFTIVDKPNGFKFGNVTVKSNLNPKPKTYEFTTDKRVSGNSISGVYELKFEVSGASPSQEYMISSVILVDHNGVASYYPPGENQLSPFMELEGYYHSISVVTPRVVETVLPTLRTFNVLQIYRDSYRITFSVTDTGSRISDENPPIIYLIGYGGEKQEIVPTLDRITSSNTVYNYEVTFNIDYLLAYHGCLISLYGIYDNDLNINGYSSLDLKSMGYTYYIKKTWSVDPIVSSFTSIGQSGGLLTIYGKRFKSSSSRIDYRTTVTPIYVSTNVIVYDYPATLSSQPITVTSIEGVDYTFNIKPTLPLVPTNNVLYVDTLSNCKTNCGSYNLPYPSLSLALKNSKERTTLILKDGVYKGEDNMNIFIESAYTNIRPMNSTSKVVFDCENYFQLFNVKGSKSFTLSNVTITSCTSSKGGALLLESSVVTLQNIKFLNNKATNGAAIYLLNTELKLVNAVFKENKAITSGAAIYSYLSSVNIKGYFTTFVDNTNFNTGTQSRDILCQNSTLNIDDDVYIKDINVKCLQGCDNFYSQRDICHDKSHEISDDAVCGDNVCSASESCLSCKNDCQCYIEGMVQETFEPGCSPTYFIPDNLFENGTNVKPCVPTKRTTLPVVHIENFMGGIKNVVVRLFGYVSVESSKEVPFNFYGTNFGLIFKVNGQQQFYFNQNTFFNETKTLYLVDKHVHFIEIILFTSVVESSERTFTLAPFEDATTKLFYSNLVCGDGILNEREAIEPTEESNPDESYYCITDLGYPIFQDQPKCGDNICNEEPNSCFQDCYIEYTPVCSATKVIEGAISPGFSVGEDTLGLLISNQFIWRLPGSEHLSFGVDITRAEEAMAPIFQFDYCQDAATNVLEDVYRGKLYQIPLEFNGKAVPECTFSTSTESFKTTKEMATSDSKRVLHEAETSFQVTGPAVKGGASASFSKDKTNTSAKKILSSNSQRIFRTDLLCKSTYVELDLNRVSFHPNLLESFNQVQTPKDMLKLVQRHGTHFYKKTFLGGRLSQIAVTDESNVDESNESSFSESYKAAFSASVSAPAFSVKTSNSGSLDRNNDEKTQQTRSDQSTFSKIITYGGVPAAFSPAQDGASSPAFGEWAQSIDRLPVPIDYQLYPISHLINEEWTNQYGMNIKELWLAGEELFYATKSTSESELFGTDYSILFEMLTDGYTDIEPIYKFPVLDIKYYPDPEDLEKESQLLIPVTYRYVDRFGNKYNGLYSNMLSNWSITSDQMSFYQKFEHLNYHFHIINPYFSNEYPPHQNMMAPYRFDFKAPDFINSYKKPVIKLNDNGTPIDFNKEIKIISWSNSLAVILDRNGLKTDSTRAYGTAAFESKYSPFINTNIKFTHQWSQGKPEDFDLITTNVSGITAVRNHHAQYPDDRTFFVECNEDGPIIEWQPIIGIPPSSGHAAKCIEEVTFSFDQQTDSFSFTKNFNEKIAPTTRWHSFNLPVPEDKSIKKMKIKHPDTNIGLASRINWITLLYPQKDFTWKYDVLGYHIKENQIEDTTTGHTGEWITSNYGNNYRSVDLLPINTFARQIFFYPNYNFRYPFYPVPDGWEYPFFHSILNSTETTEISSKFKDTSGEYTFWVAGQPGYVPTPDVEV